MALAPFAKVVREFHNKLFPNRWICRGGWKMRSPRSPHWTPNDFFRGHVKQNVYSEPITNLQR